MTFDHKWIYSTIGILCAVFMSCGSGHSPISHFIGTTVGFPKELTIETIGESTQEPPDTTAAVKIVVYTRSEGCDDCSLKVLSQWKRRMAEMDSLSPATAFVFIFAPARWEKLYSGLQVHRFTAPVFYDSCGAFERSNPGLPTNPVFHTFLLDKENRVVLVGSPIGNPKMWELYKSTIARLAAHGGTFPDEQNEKFDPDRN